jgi:hypothetical protein
MADLPPDNLLEAPCGLHCGICYLYRAKDDKALRSLVSKKFNLPENKTACPGCRAVEGVCPVIGDPCATYVCTKEKGIMFCSECQEFPCRKLMPCADGASDLPQNIKVFSLALRKYKGEEEWKKSIMEAYKLYFTGEMIIGQGPVKKD